MAQLHGLDIEETTRLADSVERAAIAADTVASVASTGAQESVRIWVGADADDFRGDLDVHPRPSRSACRGRAAGDGRRDTTQPRRADRGQRRRSSDRRPDRGSPIPRIPRRPGPARWARAPGPAIGSTPGDRTWTWAFDYGERTDGRLIGEYETGWEFGAAAAGSAYYREVPGGFEFDARAEGRSGFQAQVGGTYADELLGQDLNRPR